MDQRRQTMYTDGAWFPNRRKKLAMPTAAQRGMNARVALQAAVAYYENRQPTGGTTAQVEDVKRTAQVFAKWLDNQNKERNA